MFLAFKCTIFYVKFLIQSADYLLKGTIRQDVALQARTHVCGQTLHSQLEMFP